METSTTSNTYSLKERGDGMKKKLTYTNLVKIGDDYVPLKDLTPEQRADFGNYVRRHPMEVLGYIVEEKTG